ncbi:MAG TPA: protein phosphatase 2C domain-containing protein [Bryobacteraceae bacterium]|nr:protein phosphatase 2C domain-containing protein [Bryobacteraceae bacterium]
MIESYGLSHVGCVRQENQDRILTDHSLGLFVVADGMGGHQHGEKAAELAIDTMRYYVDSSRDRFDVTWPFGYNFELSLDANRLSTGIQLANRHVWNYAEQSSQFSGMGTTIAAILSSAENAVIGNVGDSRVYLFRKNELQQLTMDDTFLAAAAVQGADAANNPMRNVLTQAAGAEHLVDVHIKEVKLESGDLFLITSDGLHAVIGDAAMRSILGAGAQVEHMADRLVAAARVNGAPDNVSCVLLTHDS